MVPSGDGSFPAFGWGSSPDCRWVCLRVAGSEFAEKPGLGKTQLSVHRCRRNLERLGGLVVGQPPEKRELDDLAFAIIECRQLLERVIEMEDIGSGVWKGNRRVVEGESGPFSPSLVPFLGSRVVHQDVAHDASGHGEKMNAVFPIHVRLHQAQVRFVDERGGLQCVIRSFGLQAAPGDRLELGLYQRHELIQGFIITAAPLRKELGNGFAGAIVGRAQVIDLSRYRPGLSSRCSRRCLARTTRRSSIPN